MKDNEIIKALRCCADKGCKFCAEQGKPHCKETVASLAWDLIYRQKAEIERLEKLLDEKCDRCIERTKSEAYREFMGKFVTKLKNAIPTIMLKWEIDRALREAYAELTEKGGTSE